MYSAMSGCAHLGMRQGRFNARRRTTPSGPACVARARKNGQRRRHSRRLLRGKADLPSPSVTAAFDPRQGSPLWYPRHAHRIVDALAACKINRIVARSIDTQTAKIKARIERKSGLRGGPCFIQMAEKRQGGSMLEMSQG